MPGRGKPFRQKSLDERLAEYTKDEGGCIVWHGARDKDGYGYTCIKLPGDEKSKNRRVHRLVWMQAFGEIPDGLVVMHTCDNPSCVFVGHLMLGTPKANSRDRDRKGRGNFSRDVRGERNPNAKLTDAQVAEIRHRHRRGSRVGPDTTLALAEEFGVDRSQIQRLARKAQRR